MELLQHVQQGTMKMVKGLGCLSYKEGPRELSVHPGAEKAQGRSHRCAQMPAERDWRRKGQTHLSERMSTNWNKANLTKTWEKLFSAKFIKHWNRWWRDFVQSQYLGISKLHVDMALSNLLLSPLQYAGELDYAISKSVLQPQLFCDSFSDFHFMLLIVLFSCTKCSVSLVWSQVK